MILIFLKNFPESFASEISNLKKTAIAKADVIDELTNEKLMRFNIVIYGNNSKFSTLSNEIIKKSNASLEVQVLSGHEVMRYEMNIPRVIIASSKVKFSEEIYQQFEVYSPYINAITIIFYYCYEKIDTSWTKLNMQMPGVNRILYLNYSNSNQQGLTLYSNLKYQEGLCENYVLVPINSFLTSI